MIKQITIAEINGNYQTRFNAEEHHYNFQQRWDKVTNLVKRIFTDFCNLFSIENWNEVKSIFTGKNIIKKEQTSILSIHEVGLKPITFEHPYKEIEKNKFDHQKAVSEIKHETFQHLARHVENISYDQLFDGLNGCVEKFKELVGDRPYQVGILVKKSQGWLAKIAQNYFGLSYASAFGLFSDPVVDIQATAITHPATDIVFFDDISYSGSQVYEITQKLILVQAASAFKNKPINVYVIIPFMTHQAKKQLETIQERAGQNVNLHLITTNKSIPTAIEITPLVRQLGEIQPSHALCIPEWKAPDGTSFPPCFRDFCKKNIIPPYK